MNKEIKLKTTMADELVVLRNIVGELVDSFDEYGEKYRDIEVCKICIRLL